MKKSFIFYPFLFAIFPIIFLFSHNISELSLLEVRSIIRLLLPILISLGCTGLLWGLLKLFIKNPHKRGFLLFVMLFLFFSYGHFSQLYSKIFIDLLGREVLFQQGSFMIGRNKVYAGGCLLLFSLSLWGLLKYPLKNLSSFSRFLNAFSVILLILSCLNIASYEVKRVISSSPNSSDTAMSSSAAEASSRLPDIYYVILDAYASVGTLNEFYAYDNSEFLTTLKKKGFYVASKSHANYAFTILSLASSLNMEHLASLSSTLGKSRDLAVPIQKFEHNAVLRFLKSKGYRFTHVRSGWIPVEYTQYLDQEIDCDGGNVKDKFVKLLLETTLLKPFFRLFFPTTFNEFAIQRERILCQFSQIPQGPSFEAPQFIFAHIPAPHWPYVFGEHGEEVSENAQNSRDEKQKYIAQLSFINTKVLELVENILSNTERDPMIILQADHGSWNHDHWQGEELYKTRMRIFNAYHLPDGGNAILYDSITPVNSFRLIFNYYFGTDYEQLEDRSYYSWFEAPYDFLDVTETLTH